MLSVFKTAGYVVHEPPEQVPSSALQVQVARPAAQELLERLGRPAAVVQAALQEPVGRQEALEARARQVSLCCQHPVCSALLPRGGKMCCAAVRLWLLPFLWPLCFTTGHASNTAGYVVHEAC